MAVLNLRRFSVNVDVDPARIASRNPLVADLRRQLLRMAGDDLRKVDDFIGRRLVNALEAFGERYVDTMMPLLEQVARLRDELTDVYDSVLRSVESDSPDVVRVSVLRGESVRPDVVRDLFERLDKSLDGLVSPSRFLKEQGISLPPPGLSPGAPPRTPDPVRRATVTRALAGELDAFHLLEETLKPSLVAAAEAAPDDVRRVIVSSEGGLAGSITDLGRNLKARGFSDAEVERAVKSAEQLNAARSLAAQRAAAFDENLRAAAAIGQIPEMDLKKRVEGSPFLTVLASTGVPMLRHLWGMYVEYKKRRAGSAVGFDRYVWYLTKHLRGDFGEFELAFALGDGFLLLKSPDHRPTIPGTDVVAVCRATGEIWVLDNKAFQSAGAIAAVGALTKNLPKNLIADMQEYSRSYGDPAQLTVDVAGPLRRLELAAEAVRAYVAGPPVKDVTKDDVQVEITNILARPEFRIRRVVSAAAGASSGVTPRLEKIGLDYLNLQEGEAEPEAPLITVP